MATTEWMWSSINRALDYSSSGGGQIKRNNWVLTRYRISNAAYTSLLDTTATSLSAKNGGVTETVLASGASTYETGIRFGATGGANWEYSGNTWRTTGRIVNTFPSYRYDVSGSVTHICWLADDVSSGQLVWCAAATTPAVADGLAWPTEHSVWANSAYTVTVSPTFPQAPDWYTFGGATRVTGTWSGSSQPTSGSWLISSPSFLCTADNQIYNQQSVDWYTQRQTWSMKDAWQAAV